MLRFCTFLWEGQHSLHVVFGLFGSHLSAVQQVFLHVCPGVCTYTNTHVLMCVQLSWLLNFLNANNCTRTLSVLILYQCKLNVIYLSFGLLAWPNTERPDVWTLGVWHYITKKNSKQLIKKIINRVLNDKKWVSSARWGTHNYWQLRRFLTQPHHDSSNILSFRERIQLCRAALPRYCRSGCPSVCVCVFLVG